MDELQEYIPTISTRARGYNKSDIVENVEMTYYRGFRQCVKTGRLNFALWRYVYIHAIVVSANI